MKDQSQRLNWINQESPGDQTWGRDLNLPDGICPTSGHSLSHWGSNPRKIMVIHRIRGPLLLLLLHPPH